MGVPICQMIVCDALFAPEFGSMSCSTDNNGVGTECSFACNEGYELVGAALSTCGVSGFYDQMVPVCQMIVCDALFAPEFGSMSCSTDNNGVGTECSFACNEGYELVGAALSTCGVSGFYDQMAPMCVGITCLPVFAPEFGSMSCSTEDNGVGTECTFSCNTGYTLVGATVATCLASGFYDEMQPECAPILCDGLMAPEFGSMSCSTDNNGVGTECSFSCNTGYELVGAALSICGVSGFYSDMAPMCQMIVCDALFAPEFGSMSCSTDNNGVGTECSFACNEGYELVGAALSTCGVSGFYDQMVPVCELSIIYCTSLSAPMNGAMSCTNDDDSEETVCSFTCDAGYALVGEASSTCMMTGFYSNPVPMCRALAMCPDLGTFDFGAVSCSDGAMEGSVCSFSCETDLLVFPADATSATCQMDGTWSRPLPCCISGAECPGDSAVDIAVVLDSSSSVTAANWPKMITATLSILDEFTIAADKAQVSVFRYNREVDTDTQILFGDYNTKTSLYAAINAIPYDGKGTYTGQALDHCTDVILSGSGNRAGARDVVIVITDGKSQDDVVAPAQRLHDTNALVFVLAIGDKMSQPIVKAQLDAIALNPNRLFTAADFDELDDLLIAQIKDAICTETACLVKQADPIVCPALTAPDFGSMSCSTSDHAIGTTCTFSCMPGYDLVGAVSSTCLATGLYDQMAPTCAMIVCDALTSPEFGSMSCSTDNHGVGTECTFTCNEGYNMVGAVMSTCMATGFYSDMAPLCQLVACMALEAPLFGEMVCSSDTNGVGTTCGFSCNPGYNLVGAELSTCLATGFYDLSAPSCQFAGCDALVAPEFGTMMCSTDNNEVGTMCSFSCNQGYQLVGAEMATCLAAGFYDQMVPTCQLITCKALIAPAFGTISCSSANNEVGTACGFACNPGYQLVGAVKATCMATGFYDEMVPMCQQMTMCPAIGTIDYGVVSCSNDNYEGSVCSFSCIGADWDLYPAEATSATCGSDGNWDRPKPCCVTGGCPLNAKVDISIVLDSSSSVRANNWPKMINLVTNVLDEFTIGPNAAQVSVFRYNKVIDTDSQILFGQYNDSTSLYTQINKIPYNGAGTYTGQALNYVHDVVLSPANGNRPDVPDLVLIMTDGVSQDDIEGPAVQLHDNNAVVFVVAIGNRISQPRVMSQLMSIVGGQEQRLLSAQQWDDLDDQFVSLLSDSICADRCSIQYAPNVIPTV